MEQSQHKGLLADGIEQEREQRLDKERDGEKRETRWRAKWKLQVAYVYNLLFSSVLINGITILHLSVLIYSSQFSTMTTGKS